MSIKLPFLFLLTWLQKSYPEYAWIHGYTTFRQWWISNTVIYKRYFVDTIHTAVNLLKCKEKNCSIQCNTSETHFGIALNHTQTWSYTVCHKRIECDKFCEQYIKSKAQKASHFHSTSSRKLTWFPFGLISNKLPWNYVGVLFFLFKTQLFETSLFNVFCSHPNG